MIRKLKVSLVIFAMLGISFIGIHMVSSTDTIEFNTRSKGGLVIPVTDAEISFSGEAEDDNAGWSVSISGDFNGDGINDILISASYNNSNGINAGKVYLIYGSDNATIFDKNFDLGNSNASFYGEVPYSNLATSVCNAGDVNGDGIDDLMMSSSGFDGELGKTYIFFGRKDGFKRNMSSATCNASYIGEYPGDYSGTSIYGLGDVNGDGLDDIIITAPFSSRSGLTRHGAVYLIFGKESGWSKNETLSNADVIFEGEEINDNLYGTTAGDMNGDGFNDIVMFKYYKNTSYLFYGHNGSWKKDYNLVDANITIVQSGSSSISSYPCGAGDMNGDGFDDLMISNSMYGSDYSYRGRVLLFFGNSTNGKMTLNETHANASFHGAGHYYYLGRQMSRVGDINMDGCSDILVGADNAYYNGIYVCGVTYLVYGKPNGWVHGQNISSADVTIHGTKFQNYAGYLSDGPGDIDNDGYMDIIIGARGGTGNHQDSGVVHLFNKFVPDGPKRIYSVGLYSDDAYSEDVDQAQIGDRIYIEVIGEDGNTSTVNQAYVKVGSSSSIIELRLRETAESSGRYRGFFTITNRSSVLHKLLKAEIGDRIFVNAKIDATKYDYVDVITPVQLRPLMDKTVALEDHEYRMTYYNFGVNTIHKWDVQIDSDWLQWDMQAKDLFGTPDHSHARTESSVMINISDSEGHWDRHDFTVYVYNADPVILTENVMNTAEDFLYHVDYDCDDEGLGDIVWGIETNATWLSLNSATGNLTGTPENIDVGWYNVEISVDDGKGGTASTEFILNVTDTNDPPDIETIPKSNIDEDDEYYVNFRATDIDGPNNFIWGLETDGTWLMMDEESGLLNGTPTNEDVGLHNITVSAEDFRGGVGYLNYSIEVFNTNDAPAWTALPEDIEVDQGEWYSFMIGAEDQDVGDEITYGIFSTPSSNITIDPETGEINWYPYLEDPPYKLAVEVSASDGEFQITSNFVVTVVPNIPPVVDLVSPQDGKTVVRDDLILEWEGCDGEECDLTYDIYLTSSFDLITALSEDCMVLGDCIDTTYNPTDLTYGTLYYWSVIPSDGLCYGSCMDGMHSFYVNTPPMIEDIPIKEATAGESFIFMIPGADDDATQFGDLSYDLLDGPVGLEVSPGSGRIQWTPSDSQVGKHDVTVEVFDEYEYAQKTFTIDVKESASTTGKSASSAIIVAVSLILLVIILGIILAFVLTRKKEEPEEEDEPEDEEGESEDDEKLEVGAVMKDDDLLIDDEDEHDTAMERRYRDVPISSTEAYRNINRSDHKLSYNELYNGGQEEELEEHMKELENMQEPPEENDLADLSRVLEEEKEINGPKPTEDMEIEALSSEDPYDHQEYVEG